MAQQSRYSHAVGNGQRATSNEPVSLFFFNNYGFAAVCWPWNSTLPPLARGSYSQLFSSLTADICRGYVGARARGLGCKFFQLQNCHDVAVDGYCGEWPS